jgi:glyoxylase-like metal-dependent hydrolase (beta-lactamase superfamily II)
MKAAEDAPPRRPLPFCGAQVARIRLGVLDPGIDRYQGLAAQHGLNIRYVIDTHTHGA